METLRVPFFIGALVLMAVVVVVETGSGLLGRGESVAIGGVAQALNSFPEEVREAFADLDDDQRAELTLLAVGDKPPGYGILYLALMDGILLFTVVLIAASLLVPERVHGRIQGVITFIFALLLILGAIALIFAVVVVLLVMVSLLLSVPFGTLAYLARYGFFNTGLAQGTLALLMTLKVAFVVALLLAQQRFLQNKGLVLMILLSFVATVIVTFLHGLVPRFLVSITDAIAAIIVGIIAVIAALVLLIGSVGSVVKALRPDRV
jgi:hypothetical protein